ncbi:DNA polymerase [Polyangium aurulentum]|uniref:DNA polymerase n=1 Tax=Polyangium aurulentum TaxID=2567896 RepID=UPI0010AEE9D4|nr:DNA polymerase [Polyangium aurulentum]UQA57478.1 hypothetical protein E8A73_040365 [Polyangium aurulentum]
MNLQDENQPGEVRDELANQENKEGTTHLPQGADADTKKNKNKDSPQTQLVALAAGVELFRSPDGRAFATIEENGHRETYAVRGPQFSMWLRRRFFQQSQSVPGGQSMHEALSLLEARAQFEGHEEPVHVRIAEKNGAVYIDLGDPEWRAAEITPSGWQVVANPPVKFRRPRGMQQLPQPVPGGNVRELRRYVNVASDQDFALLVAWLVGAMRPSGPYPIAILQGEQASAKSTTARVLRKLIDPSTAPVRRAPRDERDLMIAAQNGWVLAYDNLSGLPVWLSDALCCIATGAGQSTRKLRTDDDEVLFSASRPLIMNGIDAVAVRADLADRSMVLTLPPIPEDKRQDEGTFWGSFAEAAPRIHGALLDGVSTALRNIGSVKLPSRPRMADFALWATAAETAFGWAPGTFMAAYAANRAQAIDTSLEADVVATALRTLLAACPGGTWEGSATELHGVLRGLAPDHVVRTRDWPQAANALTNRLRRAAPALRAVGITYEDLPRSGKAGERKLRLRRGAVPGIVSIVSSPATTTGTASPSPNAADGLAPTTVSQDDVDRQRAVADDMADSAGNLERADGADDTDDPRAGSSGVVAQVHRDASSLPALADAIIAAGRVGLVVEATGPARLDVIRAVGIGLPDGAVHVIDLFSTGELGPVAGALRQALIVGHDLAPALAHLADEFDFEPGSLFDTMTAYKLVDGGLHLEDEAFFTLGRTCAQYLGLELQIGQRNAASTEPISDVDVAALAQRVKPLLPLEEVLREELETDKIAEVAALENAVIPIMVGMKRAGVSPAREPELIQLAPGRKFIVSSYSDIALRVLADLLEDERLLDLFQAGGDPDRLTASLVLGAAENRVTDEERKLGKALNAGFAFGMGAKAFVEHAHKRYGIQLSIEQAAELQTRFLKAYPVIARWQARAQEDMPAVVRTASGRFRYFRDKYDAYEERLSHGMKGTVADGVKKALVLLHSNPRFRELGGQIRLVREDELIVEATDEHAGEVRKIVIACMVEGMSTFVKAVPVVVKSKMGESTMLVAGDALATAQGN